jgi:hypothetical protein
VTSALAATPNRNRGRKTLDAEDPRVNGQGYLADGLPGSGVADDQFREGSGPTIPLGRWIPDGDGTGGAYPPDGGQVPNGNGHDVLSAGSELSAEATEGYAFPEAAASSHGPGRWLRSLIGVDERVLDRVWEERARYTCVGAIVLGTATMATLSMLDALDQVFGPIWPVLVLVALFWGAFICGIDRWLIASTHGARSGQWHVFLPRIFLALLFGVIIATPLVLTVFGSEVVSRAQNDQSNALLRYESQLKQCNPLPDASAVAIARPPGCAQFRVPVGNPAIGTDQAIASEQAQRDQLNKLIASDNSQITNLNTIARDECNGVSATGLSGVVGVGPNCNRDRQKADSFTRTSNVAELQDEVTSLDNKIATQTVTAGQQTQTYSANISTAVANLVATKKQQEGRIGLLNRIEALGELASAHFVIAAATVLLAIFIIAIDCLPVLSKMMSGMTRYDKILEFRLKIAERMAADTLKVAERRATSRDEIELNKIESHVRSELERIDEASRFERAERDAELDRKIAYLAAEYRRLADVEGGIA